MISLYPSHIHISFPCPYISHIHKSFIIFAGCPATCVFFHFSFLWHEDRLCLSCDFLVLVLWMVFAPSFVPLLVSFFIPFLGPFLVSSVVPFFDPPRLSFRPSARFLRFVLRPAFRPAHRFVCPFGRVGWAVRGDAPFCSARLGLAGVCVFFRVLVSWRQ